MPATEAGTCMEHASNDDSSTHGRTSNSESYNLRESSNVEQGDCGAPLTMAQFAREQPVDPSPEAVETCPNEQSQSAPLDVDPDEQSNSDDEEELDDDGNPALGCVCGEIHDKRCAVFWIQCDECDAWYNVAKR